MKNIIDHRTKILISYNYDYVINNIIVIIAVYFLALIIINLILKNKKYLNVVYVHFLFLYHTVISLFLYFITLYGVADSRGYYYTTAMKGGEQLSEVMGYSVKFIYFVLYPFIHYLKLTYLSCTLIFNLIGFFGLFFLYLGLGELVKDSEKALKYLRLTLLIPGLSYWSGFTGKDPIVFFSICLLIYSINNISTRFIAFFISITLMVMARPYIGLISLVALLSALFLSSTIKAIYKVFFILIVCSIIIITANIFITTYGLEDFTYEQGSELITSHQGEWGGGSDVDLSKYNIIFKIITFLFRPFFIDARGIMPLLNSFENLIYLYLIISIFSVDFLNYIKNNNKLILRFNFIFFIIGTILLSQANANLGTIVRKKIMIAPSLIAIFILYISQKKEKINKRIITQKSEINGGKIL